MNRRKLISVLGTGVVTSVAGCTMPEDEPEEEETEGDESEETEEVTEEDIKEQIKNEMIRDSKRITGHNLYISRLNNLTDSEFRITSNVTINPVADYDLKLHYIPLLDVDGTWELKNPRIPQYYSNDDSIEVYYDEPSNSWTVTDAPSNILRYEYEITDTSFSNVVSTKTVPKNAFGEPDNHIGEELSSQYTKRFTWNEKGNPIELDFDIGFTPDKYEPFVIALSWEDSETHSPKSGEIITSSQPIIRTGEDEYEYGVKFSNSSGPHYNSLRNRDPGDFGDAIRKTSTGGETEINVLRFSNSGRFSEKMSELNNAKKNATGDNIISTYGPMDLGHSSKLISSTVDMPWNVSFTVSDSELEEAVSLADSLTTTARDSENLNNMISEDDVVNHRIVKDIASQIGEARDMMNITEPIGEIRLVCDFIQSITYKSISEGNEDTSHPVEVLVNGFADCKDCSVLAYSILKQEPFNFDLDIPTLYGITDYKDVTTPGETYGHTSIGVPKSELGISGSVMDTDVLEGIVNTEFDENVKATYTHNGTEYVYIELISMKPIGLVSKRWYDSIDGNIQSLNELV